MIDKLVNFRNESEIINNWHFDDKVYVSIICCTFNQEKYIRDAINSFLSQICNYRFEIILHDDCSTDNTYNILIEYALKFPEIIKIVKPSNNLFSSVGINYPFKNALSYADGEYISICEGDDFWIDKHKLQKQIVELEKNKDINICFTAAYGLDPQKNISKLCDYKKNKIFNCDDVILGGGGFMPTASLMIRKKILDNLPDWFYNNASVGDYFIQVLASKYGAIYIHDFSSVYRLNSIGSWSNNRKKINVDKMIFQLEQWVFCLNSIQYKNKKIINKVISESYLNNSYLLYKKGFYADAKCLLDKSWGIYRYVSVKQMLLKIFLRN